MDSGGDVVEDGGVGWMVIMPTTTRNDPSCKRARSATSTTTRKKTSTHQANNLSVTVWTRRTGIAK